MAYIEQVVDIAAPPDVVWPIVSDVERWPEWTPSARRIKLLDDIAELRNTARARVRLRGMGPSVWTVTEFDAGRSFRWDTTVMPGLRVTARHIVEPRNGGSHVTLSITSTGVMARPSSGLIAWMSRRNMALESAGLKRRAEERAKASATEARGETSSFSI